MSGDPDQGDDIAIELAEASPRWREALPQAGAQALAAARAALAGGGRAFDGPGELSLVLGDDALVHGLNRAWRGKDAPTNVLSFGAGEGPLPPGAPRLLGDVELAFETVAAEAAAQGKPLSCHLAHLVVHGVLHLLGFDHESAAEAERMEALETRILAGLGVPDPYRLDEACHG
ncbi:MAG TPA: rRNA maturation RNase YbeY [Stellaceae bacterium]|nr:rRNA maturation RNase YbeY [Stellaceae bacterium]